MHLKDKVILISGGSRGIGLAIAKRAAQDGAKITIAAKTTEPHLKLEGTIYSACEEIEAAGGQALPIKTDIRFHDQIKNAVDMTLKQFGKIDVLINNASAVQLTGTLHTEPSRFDLMHQVNVRGTYLMSQACIPHLKNEPHSHILNLSPPLNLEPIWFEHQLAYTMSKYGMSMCVLGMAAEFRRHNIMINALWPRTVIATAAANMIGGDTLIRGSRTTDIMADAAYWILSQKDPQITGQFFIDDEIITQHYPDKNLEDYRVDPTSDLIPDFFID